MFFTNYVAQCANYTAPDGKKGIAPTAAAEAMGFKKSVVTRWSKGSVPRAITLQRIANFFGCTVEELTAETKKQPTREGELSDDESEVIRLFRLVSPETRLAMLHLLRVAEVRESTQDASSIDR